MDKQDIIRIIKENPAKDNVIYGRELHKRLGMCISDIDLDKFHKRSDFFESEDIFKERKAGISNVDLFARVLQKETMVFTAKGGSSFYKGLEKKKSDAIDAYISKLTLDMSLRQWIQSFALNAYNIDPMGVVFMEISEDGKDIYPTYKSINVIYDYKSSGQQLDYICFSLSEKQVKALGIEKERDCKYFRFVDEVADYILMQRSEEVIFIDGKTIPHKYGKCPAITISDIVEIKNDQLRKSKMHDVVELAESYLVDRSIRDLSKMYHGFPKLVQPTVMCKRCGGNGFIGSENGNISCPDCEGSGQKIIKKVSDTINIPLSTLDAGGSFDIKKIFTYITPDITTWNKQDSSITEKENKIHFSYWGAENAGNTGRTDGVSMKSSLAETATKTMTNLQPIYARLDYTARWSEKVETRITDFIGSFLFPNDYKGCVVSYGRDYILESTDDLYTEYLKFKEKGSPIFVLNDYLDRYLQSLYLNNNVELSIALKMIEVEPLVHYTMKEVIEMGYDVQTQNEKRYFSEWYNAVSNEELISKTPEELRAMLTEYVKNKQIVIVQPEKQQIN